MCYTVVYHLMVLIKQKKKISLEKMKCEMYQVRESAALALLLRRNSANDADTMSVKVLHGKINISTNYDRNDCRKKNIYRRYGANIFATSVQIVDSIPAQHLHACISTMHKIRTVCRFRSNFEIFRIRGHCLSVTVALKTSSKCKILIWN